MASRSGLLRWLALAWLVFAPLCARAQGARAQETVGPVQQSPDQPLVQGIVVEGEQRYTEAQLAQVLGQTIGKPYDRIAADMGLKRLWTSFHVNGRIAYREVSGGWELHLIVEEMAVDREPRFVGNESIDDKTLRKWAQLEERSELYLHQAGRVRQRILENYKKEGYYFAEVNILTREGGQAGELPDVIFEIREGKKVRVSAVAIHGNRSMPDKRFLYFFKEGLSNLAGRELWGPTLFNWLGSKFVEEELQADLVAMSNVYRERGWVDAVVEVERLEFNEDYSRVTIHITIDEGERYRVVSLAIKGAEWDPNDPERKKVVDAELIYPEADLLELMQLKPGVIYEAGTRQKDAQALREYYGKRGHISHGSLPRALSWAFAPPDLVWDAVNHTVAVTYRIVQGKELKIREILLNGTTHTRDRVVRRELSVFPGQRADLKEIERSLGRIVATTYFSDPQHPLEHREPNYRFVPVGGDESAIDLEFLVDEGRVIDFNISGGIGSDNGAFASLDLKMRNFDITDLPDHPGDVIGEIYRKEAFHGAGQLLEINLSPGTEFTTARVHFQEPDIFRTHLRPTAADFDIAKILRAYDSHDEDREQLNVRLSRRFGYDVRAGLGFTTANVKVSDLDDDGVPPALLFQKTQGETNLTGLTFDASARSLDNFYTPHSGYVLTWRNEFFSTDIGGDYDITTTEVGTDFYLPTGEKEDGTKPVLHVEINAGAMQPYDDTFAVPYTERYFLGGQKSLRGFAFRGVGPIDQLSGFPLGGETQLYGTFEWFYPVYSLTQPGSFRRLEALRIGGFFDYGVLDPESWHLDMDELRTSAGISFGLAYPLPISINFGYPIREFDGDERQTFTFSIGTR